MISMVLANTGNVGDVVGELVQYMYLLYLWDCIAVLCRKPPPPNSHQNVHWSAHGSQSEAPLWFCWSGYELHNKILLTELPIVIDLMHNNAYPLLDVHASRDKLTLQLSFWHCSIQSVEILNKWQEIDKLKSYPWCPVLCPLPSSWCASWWCLQMGYGVLDANEYIQEEDRTEGSLLHQKADQQPLSTHLDIGQIIFDQMPCPIQKKRKGSAHRKGEYM